MTETAVLRTRFGERARNLLDAKGMSHAELAQRSRLPVERIEDILSGRLIPITMRDMTVISDGLGTPLICLLAPPGALGLMAHQIVEKGCAGDAEVLGNLGSGRTWLVE